VASLIASYQVLSGGANSNTLTTPSFTPANGEVIVVKMATWDTTVTMTPSGGGQTYTARKTAAPGGFACWCAVHTATVSGSPGAMTVSATVTASSYHSMVVERWSNAALAATPASNVTINGSAGGSGVTTPTSDLTTTAPNSIVSWVSADVNAINPATRAYRLSATEDGIYDGSGGSNSVQYHAYASVASAGTVVIGMTAPTGQNWVLAGIEILDNSGGTAVNVPDAGGLGLALRSSGGAVATGVLAANDSGRGLALRSASETTVTGVLAAADSGLGLRLRSAEGAGALTGVAIADTPGLLRLGQPAESVAYGVAVADSGLGIRLGMPSAAVLSGLVVSDTPGALRLLSGQSSVSVGASFPVTVVDSPGWLRLGAPGASVVLGQPIELTPILAPVRRVTVSAAVERAAIIAPVKEVRA
jgi:hypothetical protein